MLIIAMFSGLLLAIIAGICGAHWTGVLATFAGCTAGAWYAMLFFSGCRGSDER